MQVRMKNPGSVLPDAMTAINALYKATYSAGVASSTLELVHLRASQINGCSACVKSAGSSYRASRPGPPCGCGQRPWRDLTLSPNVQFLEPSQLIDHVIRPLRLLPKAFQHCDISAGVM